jgi:hypothetical protein
MLRETAEDMSDADQADRLKGNRKKLKALTETDQRKE